MLDSIRSSAQSFGVKLAFGVIILVFVFWGIGNFNDRDYSNVVAVVNGEPIVAQEFARAYQGAEEYILRNNPGVTRAQLEKDHLGRQVLRELIQAAAMRQEAEKAGIAITPLDLRQAVGKMPVFQDEQKKFDSEAYKRYLAARRISASQYEKELSDQLAGDKVYALLTAPAWVEPGEARNRFNFLRENRILDYIFIPAREFFEQIKVEDAEIRTWYDGHKDRFAIPATVDASYIVVRPEALGGAESIPEEELLARYEASKSDYEFPEQVRAAHILVPLPEGADEAAVKEADAMLEKIRAELAAGRPFAEVADEFNVENAAGPGGELGWFGRGQTVEAFEKAAFSQEPGQVGEPVRSPFGWHLILVEEKKAAGTRPFKEVEADLRQALAAERGADKIQEVLDNLIEDNILQKPLAESAAKYNLKLERSGSVDKAGLMEKLGIKEDAAETLLASTPDSPLDTAFEAGNNYVIARIENRMPAGVKPLEDVSEEVTTEIINEKALAEALKKARTVLDEVRPLALDKENMEKFNIQVSKPVGRNGAVSDFIPNPALSAAIFDTPKGDWLKEPFTVATVNDAGALIARVADVVFPDDAEFEKIEELLKGAAVQDRMDGLYSLVLQNLVNGAKIEVTNQTLVDRGQ